MPTRRLCNKFTVPKSAAVKVPTLLMASEEFNQRKQGKRVLNLRQLKEAVKAIITKYRVEGLLSWQVHTRVIQRRVRGYQGRSSRVVRKRVHRVEVFLNQEVVAERVREMGWRVYASNHLARWGPGFRTSWAISHVKRAGKK